MCWCMQIPFVICFGGTAVLDERNFNWNVAEKEKITVQFDQFIETIQRWKQYGRV